MRQLRNISFAAAAIGLAWGVLVYTVCSTDSCFDMFVMAFVVCFCILQ